MLQELGRRKMATATPINILGNVGYDVYYLLLLVKFQSFLREIAKANGFAYVETPAVGLYLAKQHFDERRFTRTVIAHDTHLLETCEVVVKVVKDHFQNLKKEVKNPIGSKKKRNENVVVANLMI